MTILSAEEAVKRANNTHTNEVGKCQQVTREYYNAPSVGDYDGDGAADAEDGWKSEPEEAKVHGDKNPPLGAPVSFLGGSRDNGHRAITVGKGGVIRSTDFDGTTKRYSAGKVGNGTIDEVARAMGVTYAGWSRTIDGHPIPGLEKDEPKPEQTRGPNVDDAIDSLKKAAKHSKGDRKERIKKALDSMKKLPQHDVKKG